ncbi:MAG: pyrimidine 5'-nucleotidase [Alphaproteobacteria bacterium]|nr:pyrimidine 5'-nucleotidase [Alphaproteobacteria bacterium]
MNHSIQLHQSECWVFDLDNTLYPASNGLMADVSTRMTQFVAQLIGADTDEALIEQKHLFRKHGTTLRGLMEKYAVDPWSFMDFVHQVDYGQVDPSPRLADALTALPGRKIVFTNASVAHAEQVLTRLGIAEQFDGVFDVAAAAWQPKPHPSAYQCLIEKHRISPGDAVMVEDIAPNLEPAATLGMTTVWIDHQDAQAPAWTQPSAASDYVHHKIYDLTDWLEALPR